jgi:site-specific DNA-methyltransferase (adenine-specific)
MKLFYEAPGVRLYLGDCREAMSVLGEKLFSLTLADPPYEQTSLSWDSWPEGWLQAAHGWRAANGSLWCWGTLRLFMERAAEFTSSKWRLAQDTIWEKHNGSQPGGDRFLRVHEQAAHFYPVASRWSDIYREPQLVTAPPEHAHKRGRVVHRKDQPAHTGKHKPSTYVDTGMRAQRSVWHVRSMHRQGGAVRHRSRRGCSSPSSATRARPAAGCWCPSWAVARRWRQPSALAATRWAST